MSFALPDFLQKAKQTVPEWIRKVQAPSGAGRYRFALDAYEPYDLDSSCMIENTRLVIEGMPPESERLQWIEYLCSLQDSETGLLIDPAMERHICGILPDGKISVPVPDTHHQRRLMKEFIRRPGMERHILVPDSTAGPNEISQVRGWTTRNGLTTIIELGGCPHHMLSQEHGFSKTTGAIEGPSGLLKKPEDAVNYLSRLTWDDPRGWGAGSWAGSLLWYHRLNQMLGDETAEEIIRAGVKWLTEKQDPTTGCWSDLNKVRLNTAVNVVFKIWLQAIPSVKFPVLYPERIVDLCIRALREDSALINTPDACSIFDVALVLDTALHFCEHRREEVAELAAAALPRLEPLYREDGGFSYGADGSLITHGRLNLAPVCMQSDAAGTAIAVNAVSLLCDLCGKWAGPLQPNAGWDSGSPVVENFKTDWQKTHEDITFENRFHRRGQLELVPETCLRPIQHKIPGKFQTGSRRHQPRQSGHHAPLLQRTGEAYKHGMAD